MQQKGSTSQTDAQHDEFEQHVCPQFGEQQFEFPFIQLNDIDPNDHPDDEPSTPSAIKRTKYLRPASAVKVTFEPL
jgi:hypothetical protein